MGNYNEEYKSYYIRMMKGVDKNKSVQYQPQKYEENIKEDVYPIFKTRNYGTYNRSYYGLEKNINNNNSNINRQANNRYIHRLIIRLISTGLLFCGVLLLKVAPYEQTRELYNNCKYITNINFDYKSFLSSLETMGWNIKGEIQDKIETFKNLDGKDIETFKQQDTKTNIDEIKDIPKNE